MLDRERQRDNSNSDTARTSDELAKLASEVRRLRPDWRDAEAFYEQRSEISGALMRLSRKFARQPLFARPRVVVQPIPRAIAPILPAPAINSRPASRVGKHRHRFPRPPRLPSRIQLELL
jgi:hypothetical protein